MADIASLGVVVRPDGIQETTKQLDGLTKAGATAEKQTAKIAPAMDKAALSAKQLAFATRGLPAQFTDIATSLAAGQNPLQVLLQQGGQIKDQFGGAGAALRAVGGYVAGLINPFTLAAGAAALLAVAWKQGSDEAVEFNKALILTGNYAGTTADELATMAREIDAVAGTQHAAAAALSEVAATGVFTAEQIGLVAKAAEQMRVATGRDVGETVKEFTKLAGDPVRAVLDLNDKYHFLTDATYSQIAALKDQGREQDAATLAIQTYSNEIGNRTGQIRQNLGLLERAWKGITETASSAWDAMLGIGRDQTASQRAAELGRQIFELQNAGPFSFMHLSDSDKQKRIADLKAQLRQIQDDERKEVRAAAQQAAKQRAAEAAVGFKEEAKSYRTGLEKLEAQKREVEGRAAQQAADARKAGAEDEAKAIEANSKLVLAALDKQIKEQQDREKKKGRTRTATDPSVGIISRISEQIALNTAEQQSADRLTASERLRISVLADLEKLGVKVTAAQRKQIDVKLAELEASGKATEAFKEEAAAAANLATIKRELALTEENRRRANEADLLQVGRGREEAELARRRLDIEREYADNLKQLNDRAASERRQVTASEEQALRESRDRMLSEEEEFQNRRVAMLGDWRNGARAAIEDFAFEASDVASATYDIFRSAFDGLSNVISDFITKGKADFSGFLEGLAADIASFMAKQAVAEWLKVLAGGTTADGEGGWAAALAGIFGGGRARGGSVSGSKLYEVGEGGRPELLKQGSRTYLIPGNDGTVIPAVASGRAAMGGGGSSSRGDVYVSVENNSGGQARVEESQGPDGQRFVKVIVDAAVSEVERRINGMGSTGRAIQGRFGLNPTGVARG